MTWGAVAVGGATLIGAGMAANSADAASKRAAAMSKEQLTFEKEKYQNWKDTYGSLEDNLSEYYNSLTPDFYAAQGLEAFQKEQDTALMQIKTSLAQRGIEDSGLALTMERAADQEAAVNRATIRAQAPGLAAAEKRQFLQIGLGQNPGASLSQTMANRASQAQQTADQAQLAAGQAVGTAVSTVGTALSDYLATPGQQPQTTGSLPSSYVSTTNQQTQDYSGYA